MQAHGAGKQAVVIVGGSFAGRRVHALLSADPRFTLTLLDIRPYSEYTPAVLRALVEPEHALSILAPLPSGMLTARACAVHTRGDLPGGTIELEDGRLVPFDYCVFCTGSSYFQPIKAPLSPPNASMAVRTAGLAAAASDLEAAQTVVIVGGGYVGVELAAEIAGRFSCCDGSGGPAHERAGRFGCDGGSCGPAHDHDQQHPLNHTGSRSNSGRSSGGNAGGSGSGNGVGRCKTGICRGAVGGLHAALGTAFGAVLSAAAAVRGSGGGGRRGQQQRKMVTLVSSSSRLLDRLPPAAGEYCLRWLRRQGVMVVLGERVISGLPKEPRASPGSYVLETSSGRQLTADLVYVCTGSPPAGAVAGLPASERGVRVLPTLQVDSDAGWAGRVFAAGDCVDNASLISTTPHHSNNHSNNHSTAASLSAGPNPVTTSASQAAPAAAAAAAAALAATAAKESMFEKTAFTADLQAQLVAMNIQRMATAAAVQPAQQHPQQQQQQHGPAAGATATLATAIATSTAATASTHNNSTQQHPQPQQQQQQSQLQPLLTFPEGVCHGRHVPPNVVIVSLGKHDGVAVLNRHVLATGVMAAAGKLLVERFQVAVARGSWLAGALWGVMEALTVRLGTAWPLAAAGLHD